MRDLVCTWRGEWPKTSICPLVGFSRPSISLTVVDLPEPFGPSRPKTSPRRTSKLTLSTARALGRLQKSLKTFVKPRTETTASPFDCGVRIVDCESGSVVAILFENSLIALSSSWLIFLFGLTSARKTNTAGDPQATVHRFAAYKCLRQLW